MKLKKGEKVIRKDDGMVFKVRGKSPKWVVLEGEKEGHVVHILTEVKEVEEDFDKAG